MQHLEIGALVQASGGLFKTSTRFRTLAGEPRFTTRLVALGDLRALYSAQSRDDVKKPSRLVGAGTEIFDNDAAFLALAEALERYCSCICDPDQFTWASAEDFGDEVIDLDRIPRCSEVELSHPRCPLVLPNKKQRIRWMSALSFCDQNIIRIPAIMVYLHLGYLSPAERFWLPISTGTAIHRSYEQALLAAILEVIERDALTLIWLQEMRIPRIIIDEVPATLSPYWTQLQLAPEGVEYRFFDATTDLGVPTVYGLQLSIHEAFPKVLVSCATELRPADAFAKVIRDMAAARFTFRHPHHKAPKSVDQFSDVFDGATYMAHEENIAGFNFLLHGIHTVRLSEMPSIEIDTRAALQLMRKRLRDRQLDVYAIDITTDEALRCGFRTVKVIIPGLQPLSFHHCARYLGSPRVFEAPRLMGHPVHSEEGLNPWPQPFA